jgi:predicted phage terminase large subunit-like protein
MVWKQAESLGNLLKERQRQKARRDLLAYCQFVYPPYKAGRHHCFVIEKLGAVERGEISRVMVSEPPQHGKTLTVSQLFSCWYLGRNPRRKVVVATYGDDRAQDIGRSVLRTLKEDSHHREIFPEAEVDANAASQARIDLLPGGSFYAVGRGGSLTGRSADLLIIDDLFKDDKEARSAAVRREVIEWYSRVALTRLAPDGAVILVGTRWGRGDLFDYLLSEREEKSWFVVNLPALAETNDPLGRREGEPLWPERYGLDALKQKRIEVGGAAWTCLYQGQPTAAEGCILHRDWWQYYTAVPETFERRIISVDSAFKTGQQNDYSVMQVWGKTETGFYLLANWRERVEFPELKKTLVAFGEQWRPHAVLIEDSASGQSLIQELRATTALPLKPIRPDRDKESRAAAITSLLECGCVFLPQSAGWLDDFLDEASAFPRGAHDDQVDALTQALNYFHEGINWTGTWMVQMAREAKANQQPQSVAEELGSAQKRKAVETMSNVPSVFGAERGSGYRTKTVEDEMAKRQAKTQPVKECPWCRNQALGRAGDYAYCKCGWNSKQAVEPPPAPNLELRK